VASKALKPRFFATPAELRAWLVAHHESASELLVGFYKRGSRKPSITWPESVDEALCFGWIDGVRESLGAEAYTIRFTPRRPTSIWSAINVARVQALEKAGRLTAAGRSAFAARSEARTGVYSFERQTAAVLSPEQEKELRANAAASRFFDAQPPWYRRTATHWVISAKREETRERRLAQLIADSAHGLSIAPLRRPGAASVAKGKAKKKQQPTAKRTARKKQA
jgi:uncharacterized protein YdeI (YjbR/CyaY-like superfamily)